MKIISNYDFQPVEVDAQPVVVPGYETIPFAAHRMFLPSGQLSGNWIVVELTTGYPVIPKKSAGYQSMQEAVDQARFYMDLRGGVGVVQLAIDRAPQVNKITGQP